MRAYIKIMTMSFPFYTLCAEAIITENTGYFHVSSLLAAVVKVTSKSIPPVSSVTPSPSSVLPPVPPRVLPVTPPSSVPPVSSATPPPPSVLPPVPPVGSKVTPPPSSVPLTLNDGIWRDTADLVFTNKISDHALEGQMIGGDIPVYTWNTWGFQSKGGFSASNTESLPQYQTGRLKEQIGILYQIFSNSPEAIICLQEVNEQTAGTRTAVLNGLKALNVGVEYVNNTGSESFGQVILYRTDRYKPVRALKPTTPDGYSAGAAGRFISAAATKQNGRVLKVYFEELTGKKRQLAVVNVHLAYNSPNISGLLNELVTYSQGVTPIKPLAVIAGDFNYTIGSVTPANSKATFETVGKSVIWYQGAPSTKQTAHNVDGFIVVQP